MFAAALEEVLGSGMRLAVFERPPSFAMVIRMCRSKTLIYFVWGCSIPVLSDSR